MFVIVDMEWVSNKKGHHSPTQLSAVRVDENWKAIDAYNSFIHPRDSEFHIWNHVAYTGGKTSDFLYAKNAYTVLNDFEKWLCDNDILLWWHSESKRLFKKIVSLILKKKESHKAININEYVYAFLAGEPSSCGDSYKIAEARGISTNSNLKHNAQNDVLVVRELMQKIAYPQSDLLKPLDKPKKTNTSNNKLPYQYDPNTNLIHSCDCEFISRISTRGFETLNSPIRKGFKPCNCCKEAYNTALKNKNADTIQRSPFTYIYAPNSNVFHKPTCSKVLSAKSILGAHKYETVIATGRTPCKICNPTPNDICKPLPPQNKVVNLQKKTKTSLPKSVSKAVIRQRTAVKERQRLLKSELTEIERKDVFTLTQPRFAFWVGQGYQSFHTHSCSKLHGVTNLKGFSTYREAINAGYTPCKKCKPSEKHNVKFSIPITNRIRTDEKVEDLAALCIESEYSFYQHGQYFCIETAAGKWRINVLTSPVKLEHINLVKTPNCEQYHEQPRLFLSFLDAFSYIKRHDDNLVCARG